MKKTILIMTALLSMNVAFAQQSDDKSERKAPKKPTPEQMTERMSKELNLNDAQKAKVLELNKEYENVLAVPGMRGPRGHRPDANTGATEQVKDKKQNGERPALPQLTDAQKQQMKQHMAKREEYNTKLKSILTDDQYKNYQKMHRRHGHGPEFGHRHGNGPRPEKAKND